MVGFYPLLQQIHVTLVRGLSPVGRKRLKENVGKKRELAGRRRGLTGVWGNTLVGRVEPVRGLGPCTVMYNLAEVRVFVLAQREERLVMITITITPNNHRP